MLDFSSVHPFTNISILTNGGFFTNEFLLSRLGDLAHNSKHDCHVLNKSDNVANWTNFGAFQEWTTTIAQHLQGSSRAKEQKEELKKVEESLVVVFSLNINLVEDNSDLKAWVVALELEAKGLETQAIKVEDSSKLSDEEVERLRTSLALVDKERDDNRKEKARIE